MVGWEDAVSIAIGTASTFLVAYLTNYFRKKADAKRTHLESLKRDCLTPILGELGNLRDRFIPDENYAFKVPPECPEVKWCNYFSFSSRGADAVLFNDLRNHFPPLFDRLRCIEDHIVKEVYPRYVRTVYELLKKLYERGARNDMVLAGAFFRLVGIHEDCWPNLYRTLKERKLLAKVAEIAHDVARGNQELVNEYKSLRAEALEAIEDAMRMVGEALHSQKLKGKCDFI